MPYTIRGMADVEPPRQHKSIFRTTEPEWVQSTIKSIMESYVMKAPPNVVWKLTTKYQGCTGSFYHQGSHGYNGPTIVVRIGLSTESWEPVQTFLHECAHWLNHAKKRREAIAHPHGYSFYAIAWDLWLNFNLPTDKVLGREGAHQKTCYKVYQDLVMPILAERLTQS